MKVMTESEKNALLGLCEIYKLLANKDAITVITILLFFDYLSKDDLRILCSIDEKKFDKMFDVLVLCDLIDCRKDIVSISNFGKNVIKLTEEFLGENRKINKGHKSNLIS